MDPARRALITEEMFLAAERVARDKHELYNGEIWAMGGASPRHNRLSRSTQSHDRGAKFDDYRSIASFEEYVLIWQDRIHVEVRRREGSRWISEEHSAGSKIELHANGATLDIDALYDGVFAFRGDPER